MQVIGLVEDEQCFFTLTFMKTKLKNQLTKHLELFIWMFNQKFFTTQNFSFQLGIHNWKESKIRYGVGAWRWMWILQLPFVSMIHVILDMMIIELSTKFEHPFGH
jgi:hypothetical protein